MATQTINFDNVENVSYNGNTVNTIYFNNQQIWSNDRFLDFRSSLQNFTLSLSDNTKYWDGVVEYSTDKVNWTEWDGTSEISSQNRRLYLRGYENTKISGTTATTSALQQKGTFIFTPSNQSDTIECYGNIETLLDYKLVEIGQHPTMADNCFNCLFRNCTYLTKAPRLPSLNLSKNCYWRMFNGCTSLTTAPELPATTIPQWSYGYMFAGCTALTAAPALPATNIGNRVYDAMFYNCAALTTAPELPAMTLTEYCYNNMFYGCTALTTAPELPATTIPQYAYQYMFKNSGLIYAPALPGTTLERNCYYQMFYGCTSLNTIPELPCISLVAQCYGSMFNGCTNIKLSTTQTGDYINEYRIPTSGTGTTANTNALGNMFYNTGGTFTGAPTLNTTYYTSNYIVKKEYLDFSSQSAFSIKVYNERKNWNNRIEYSTDSINWTEWDGSSINSQNNHIYLRGINNYYITGEYDGTGIGQQRFVLTGSNIYCNGKLESLLDYRDVERGLTDLLNKTNRSYNYTFAYLFKNNTALISCPEITTTEIKNNAENCFYSMYSGCTNLSTLPKLKATVNSRNNYSNMFNGCTNIKLSTTQTGDYVNEYIIPSVNTGTVYNMFNNTGGTFTGAPSTNTTYYTSNTII